MDTPIDTPVDLSILTSFPPDVVQKIFVYAHLNLDTLARTFPDSFKAVSDRDEYWRQLTEANTHLSLPSTVKWRMYVGRITPLVKLGTQQIQIARIMSTHDTGLWEAFSHVAGMTSNAYTGTSFFLSMNNNSIKILSHILSSHTRQGLLQLMDENYIPCLDIDRWNDEMVHFVANSNLSLYTITGMKFSTICSVTPNVTSFKQYKLAMKIKEKCGGSRDNEKLERDLLRRMSLGEQLTPLEIEILHGWSFKEIAISIKRYNSSTHPVLVRFIYYQYTVLNGVNRLSYLFSRLSPRCDSDDILRMFVPAAIGVKSSDRYKYESIQSIVDETVSKYYGSDSWIWYAFRLGCDTFNINVDKNRIKALSGQLWDSSMIYFNRLVLHSKDGDILTPKNIKYMFKRLSSARISLVLSTFKPNLDEKIFYSKHIHLALLKGGSDLLFTITDRYGEDFLLESLGKCECLSNVNILEFNDIAFELLCNKEHIDLLKRMRISVLCGIDLRGERFTYENHLCVMNLLSDKGDRGDIEAYYSKLIQTRQYEYEDDDECSSSWNMILSDVLLDTRYLDNFKQLSSMFLVRSEYMESLLKKIMSNPESKALCMEAMSYCDHTYEALHCYLTQDEQQELYRFMAEDDNRAYNQEYECLSLDD